jgi:hypothetical protein
MRRTGTSRSCSSASARAPRGVVSARGETATSTNVRPAESASRASFGPSSRQRPLAEPFCLSARNLL